MAHEKNRYTQRSGYRIMWMQVMFDLPVVQKKERKEARQFRKDLLDLGFEMGQFSVYFRCCSSREKIESLARKVQEKLPRKGKVAILTFTDKQYENMIHFVAKQPTGKKPPPSQLALF